MNDEKIANTIIAGMKPRERALGMFAAAFQELTKLSMDDALTILDQIEHEIAMLRDAAASLKGD